MLFFFFNKSPAGKWTFSEFYCNSHEKLIHTSTFDTSMWADKLSQNYEIYYLSLASIPAETVKNEQEYLATIRYSITSLF